MAKPSDGKKSSPDLDSVLASLTPEQLTMIRQRALAAGIGAATTDKLQRLQGGRMRIVLELPPEVTEPLYTWADAAQAKTAEEQYEFFVPMILNWITSGIYADYGGGEQPVAAAAVPASGIPAGTPATAAK